MKIIDNIDSRNMNETSFLKFCNTLFDVSENIVMRINNKTISISNPEEILENIKNNGMTVGIFSLEFSIDSTKYFLNIQIINNGSENLIYGNFAYYINNRLSDLISLTHFL